MDYIYRVVLTVGYYEVHFDFADAGEAVNFCTVGLMKMTDREDGKDCHMVIKKINIEQEKAAKADKKEDN